MSLGKKLLIEFDPEEYIALCVLGKACKRSDKDQASFIIRRKLVELDLVSDEVPVKFIDGEGIELPVNWTPLSLLDYIDWLRGNDKKRKKSKNVQSEERKEGAAISFFTDAETSQFLSVVYGMLREEVFITSKHDVVINRLIDQYLLKCGSDSLEHLKCLLDGKIDEINYLLEKPEKPG